MGGGEPTRTNTVLAKTFCFENIQNVQAGSRDDTTLSESEIGGGRDGEKERERVRDRERERQRQRERERERMKDGEICSPQLGTGTSTQV